MWMIFPGVGAGYMVLIDHLFSFMDWEFVKCSSSREKYLLAFWTPIMYHVIVEELSFFLGHLDSHFLHEEFMLERWVLACPGHAFEWWSSEAIFRSLVMCWERDRYLWIDCINCRSGVSEHLDLIERNENNGKKGPNSDSCWFAKEELGRKKLCWENVGKSN